MRRRNIVRESPGVSSSRTIRSTLVVSLARTFRLGWPFACSEEHKHVWEEKEERGPKHGRSSAAKGGFGPPLTLGGPNPGARAAFAPAERSALSGSMFSRKSFEN